MDIFKKEYTLRSFPEQTVIDGYVATAAYSDRKVSLNIQPDSVGFDLQPSAEGSRTTKKIISFGDFPIQTADQYRNLQADWVFYDGDWYECVSCRFFEHTPLRHYQSMFVRVPETGRDVTQPPQTQGGSV